MNFPQIENLIFNLREVLLFYHMVHRTISEQILQAAKQMPVISITGPRQSGKTTLCKSIFPNHLYMNLEDPEMRSFALEDPKGFLAQTDQEMVIDEAQYAPILFSYIQTIVDEQKKNGAFVLSGSQNFLLMENITQSLAGRVAIFHLLPLSLAELQRSAYSLTDPWEIIFRGGYPRLYDQQVEENLFFPGYIQTYLERDLRQLQQVSSLQQFQLFTRILAGRIGQLFNQSAIANETGLSHPTVKKWLSLLQTSFIAFSLPPYFRNFNKQLIKSPKLYFYDTGLACYLLGIRSAQELANHYAKGALFENFVIVEMLKAYYNRGIRQHLYFWRDRTGHEIDLLIDAGGKLFPVEIKASQTISTSFFKNLNFFNRISETDPKHTMVVYGGNQSQFRSNGRVEGWETFAEKLLQLTLP